MLVAAIPALALASPAFAQTPGDPAGCPGSVKTTDAAGVDAGETNENPYSNAENVYLQGENFPSFLTASTTSYEIEDVNDNAIVKARTAFAANGSQPGETFANGTFLELIWTPLERFQAGIQPGHEYKVTVFYTSAGGTECNKSDNFFITPSPVAAQFVQQVAGVGAASAGGQAFVPTVACPRGITVRPGQLRVGQRTLVTVSVRRNGQAVRNALVILRGPGISAFKVTARRGTARFNVTATRRGTLRVFVPNVCVRRAGVAGVVAAGTGLAG